MKIAMLVLLCVLWFYCPGQLSGKIRIHGCEQGDLHVSKNEFSLSCTGLQTSGLQKGTRYISYWVILKHGSKTDIGTCENKFCRYANMTNKGLDHLEFNMTSPRKDTTNLTIKLKGKNHVSLHETFQCGTLTTHQRIECNIHLKYDSVSVTAGPATTNSPLPTNPTDLPQASSPLPTNPTDLPQASSPLPTDLTSLPVAIIAGGAAGVMIIIALTITFIIIVVKLKGCKDRKQQANSSGRNADDGATAPATSGTGPSISVNRVAEEEDSFRYTSIPLPEQSLPSGHAAAEAMGYVDTGLYSSINEQEESSTRSAKHPTQPAGDVYAVVNKPSSAHSAKLLTQPAGDVYAVVNKPSSAHSPPQPTGEPDVYAVVSKATQPAGDVYAVVNKATQPAGDVYAVVNKANSEVKPEPNLIQSDVYAVVDKRGGQK